jgi:hypothetical protein
MWLSLIRIASKRPVRWLVAPPARTAYFSSARSVGVVLRVSRIPSAGRLDEASCAGGDARQPLQEIERRPLADEQRAREADDVGHVLADAAIVAVRAADRDREAGARLQPPKHLERDVHPRQDAVGFHQKDATRAKARRHHRVGGHVATAEIFVERPPDEIAVERWV